MRRQTDRRTPSRRSLLTIGVAVLLAFVVFIPSAIAVHNEGLFELDGNPQESALPGDDWQTIAAGTSTTALASAFVNDKFDGAAGDGGNDNIFSGGSTKDDLDVTGWLCKTGGAVDKNDIEHAFAAAYTQTNVADSDFGDLFVYFGADKFSTSGDAQIGFWLFQGPVGCTPGAGDTPFSGSHTIGDLLILSDFTNGGNVSNIRVFKWVGSGGNTNGTLDLILNTADCQTVNLNDDACARVNDIDGLATVWPYTPKQNLGPPDAYPEGAFYEGGINLSDLLNLADLPCFATFLAETRQSQSVDSVLEDFAYGSLNTCPDLKLEKTPDAGSYFVGDQFNWNLKVSNNGAGASNVVVTDTVPSGLEIVGTPTFDVDPNTAGGTGNCIVAAQLVTCNIGALAASDGNTTGAEPDVATVTIKVKALAAAIPAGTDAACATVNNTGSVSANREQASTSADNTDTGSVSICRLAASKNANPSFARSWTWQVDKVATGSDGTLTLDAGQSFLQEYKVTYTATSHDSGYAVDGTITITNPASIAATINSVSDVVTVGINASVDCNGGAAGDGLPATVPANGTLNCSYHAGLPDATTRTNTATATQQNYDYSSGSAVASGTTDYSTGAVSVNFAGVVPSETDESIVASDTFTSSLPAGATLCTGLNTPVTGCLAGAPPSGTVNASASPKTFTYYVFIGPFAASDCGEHNIDNTASFVTNDTATTGSDSNHIVVTVPCQQGCTLTQGYWKTHSILGPAPFDDNWNNIPTPPYAPDDGDGIAEHQNETFFLSGQTWYQVFWTAPKGNAYYILAHQYEAAVLNVLNGSDPSAITATLNSALTLLSTYTPAQVKASSSLRTQAITLAGILASYNEGAIGPGHCDEDQLSSKTE